MQIPCRNPRVRSTETFEKCSISFKIKAREDFNRRNMLNILRIEIRTQRRNWAKGGVLQRSPTLYCEMFCLPDILFPAKLVIFSHLWLNSATLLPPLSQHHLCGKGLSRYRAVRARDFIMVVCQVPDGNLEIKTREDNVVECCCHVEEPGAGYGIKGIGPRIDKLCG